MQLPSRLKDNLANAKAYAAAFFYWLVLGVTVGALCGLLGTLFAKSVSYVTQLRTDNSWLLFTLPFGGLLSVAIYKLCKVSGVGTNQVFESVRSEKPVSVFLAPAIFIGSVITHLGGGSSGREGAALQLGGSVSSLLAKVLHLKENSRHILTMCGMGALFSAIFGTPLGACVFALEVVRVGQICSAALFPALVASITAYLISGSLGVAPEHFNVSSLPEVDPDTLWRVIIIAVIGALVSVFFCHLMHESAKLFKKYLPNPYVRIFIGGTAIVLLTLLLGTNDYNGGDVSVIERIFEEGYARPEMFLLKMLFTAITIGTGFKGGEIIPTLFIGASLGGALAPLLGLSSGFGAAVGMASLFCGVTNCPLSTCFLCIEMFGAEGIVFYAISVFTSFILSGYASLYTKQKLIFSKLNEEIIDRDAD